MELLKIKIDRFVNALLCIVHNTYPAGSVCRQNAYKETDSTRNFFCSNADDI